MKTKLHTFITKAPLDMAYEAVYHFSRKSLDLVANNWQYGWDLTLEETKLIDDFNNYKFIVYGEVKPNEIDIDKLIGLTINSLSVSENNDVIILYTNKGQFYMTFNGDCCAKCYIEAFDNKDLLIGSTILEVHQTEWVKTIIEDSYDEVVEQMGIKFKTTKGYVDIETRVEHNGYYGGYVILTDNVPCGQYGDALDLEEIKFKDYE